MHKKHTFYLCLVKAMNILFVTIPFAMSWFWYYQPHMDQPIYFVGNVLICVLFVMLYTIFGKIYDAFLVSMNPIREMIYSQGLAALIADGFLYLVMWLLLRHIPNPLPVLSTFAGQLLVSACWCTAAQKWYFATHAPKKSAVIYDSRIGMDQLIVDYGLGKKFQILWEKNVEECLEDLSVLDDLETVFLSDVRSNERNIILKYCVEQDICVYVVPRVGDALMSCAVPTHMLHLPILRVNRYAPGLLYKLQKRVFDVLVSALALVVLCPILLITAIAIKAQDGGPVLYQQRRLTQNGREFNILKFRSMRVDAEKDGVARLSTGEADDRITPVGRIIRKYRIDELPQLVNILVGDLSIVGPRPERPEIAVEYEKEIPEFRLRLQAKAGLTGYAQVYGKYNTSPYDKLLMDLMYIAHPGFWQDLRICIATVKILFMPESTEGVVAGQITAADSMRSQREPLNR